jgi:hypothetical protein
MVGENKSENTAIDVFQAQARTANIRMDQEETSSPQRPVLHAGRSILSDSQQAVRVDRGEGKHANHDFTSPI